MRDTFVNTLLEEARRNPKIFLITGDLGFGVLEKFESELPAQFLNVGVAEQTMIGLASGLASTGKRVFVYSIGNFPTLRSLEQIRNDVCYMNNSVVIVAVGAGYSYGSQGYTHHALEDIATMRALPNMNVVTPCDPMETEALTKFLSRGDKPAYLRLGRSGEKQINLTLPNLTDGKFNKIFDGDDGSILFTGSIGSSVIKAREVLLSRGLEVAVFSVPFISSLDANELMSLNREKPVVVVEEHSIRGGLSSAILERAAAARIKIEVLPVFASQENLTLIGDQNYLRVANGLAVRNILSQFKVE